MRMKGLMTALVTPMRDDRVDEPAFRDLIEAQIQAGVDALVPCGTTGEAVTLTLEEREQVIALAVETARGRVPVMAGVGSNDTRTTVEAARRAEALGASAVLVVTPYYNKPTQEGMYRHFRAVAESISIDVCLYNVPGRTGVSLEAATLARLAGVPNITAIKEATGNLMVQSEMMLAAGERISMLSGDDFTTLAFIAQGGQGVISVASNIVPELMGELVRGVAAGDLEHVRKVHFRLYPLFKALFLESNPIPVKTALAMMGRMTGEMRLPLYPMSEANQKVLRAAMEPLGLLRRAA